MHKRRQRADEGVVPARLAAEGVDGRLAVEQGAECGERDRLLLVVVLKAAEQPAPRGQGAQAHLALSERVRGQLRQTEGDGDAQDPRKGELICARVTSRGVDPRMQPPDRAIASQGDAA